MSTCPHCNYWKSPTHRCPKEPQDAAPSTAWCDTHMNPTCGECKETTAGDSELAAIRKRLTSWPCDGGWATDDMATLLRMVDELRSERDGIKHAWSREDAEWRRENAELRAQLSSTDPEWDATDGAHPCWWRGHDNGAKGMAELVEKLRTKLAKQGHDTARFCKKAWEIQNEARLRVKDLEAKLAEAEKDVDIWKRAEAAANRRTGRARERAEAAEARVHELTLLCKSLEITLNEINPSPKLVP